MLSTHLELSKNCPLSSLSLFRKNTSQEHGYTFMVGQLYQTCSRLSSQLQSTLKGNDSFQYQLFSRKQTRSHKVVSKVKKAEKLISFSAIFTLETNGNPFLFCSFFQSNFQSPTIYASVYSFEVVATCIKHRLLVMKQIYENRAIYLHIICKFL